jgi:hypothetical protein
MSVSGISLLIITWVQEKEKEKKITQAVKTTPHIDQGKISHSGTEYRKTERSNRVPEGGKKSQRDWRYTL